MIDGLRTVHRTVGFVRVVERHARVAELVHGLAAECLAGVRCVLPAVVLACPSHDRRDAHERVFCRCPWLARRVAVTTPHYDPAETSNEAQCMVKDGRGNIIAIDKDSDAQLTSFQLCRHCLPPPVAMNSASLARVQACIHSHSIVDNNEDSFHFN